MARSFWLTPHSGAMLAAFMALLTGAGLWLAGTDALATQVWATRAWATRVWGVGVLPALALLLLEVARQLRRGEAGVDIIAGLSMGGALALGETLAGVVIALMFTGGNVLEEHAQRRARRELTALLARTPRLAHRQTGQALEDIAVEAVRPGDRLLVKPGEVLPVDGTLLDARASLDEGALTGESLPSEHRAGAALKSGTVNAGGPFRLRADRLAAESTYAEIVRLVEAAQRGKAPFVRLADRWSLAFLGLTLAMAGGAYLLSGDPVRALAVLVVATPCPLILAAPVAIVAGISAAARHGVLIKGGGALETLARARTVMLDKTGTLTTGVARLVGIESRGALEPAEVLRLAASLDQVSQHVLAAAIVAAARARGLELALPEAVEEDAGAGISGRIDGREVRLGQADWVLGPDPTPAWAEALLRRARRDGRSCVLVAVAGRIEGALLLADEIRRDTPRALRALHRAGVARIVMLSGDRQDVAEMIAAALGVDSVLAERSPQDKVDAVRAERADGVTIMVGDGINDAPALAAADVGVAMGARGAGAASEAAAVVLLVDRLDRLAVAIRVSQRARRIALQSVLAGMALSTLGMAAAALGYLPPVAGALVQEVIDVAVILNALRAVSEGRQRQHALPPGQLQALLAEHAGLVPALDRMRALGDRLAEAADGAGLRAELVALDTELQAILRHEHADEVRLHGQIERLVGGQDPLSAISRAHREIAHLGRRYGRLVAELPPTGPVPAELVELRRTLYALEAILRLHFAQEDEIYENVSAEGRAVAAGGHG